MTDKAVDFTGMDVQGKIVYRLGTIVDLGKVIDLKHCFVLLLSWGKDSIAH